jgi:hypothetical protein
VPYHQHVTALPFLQAAATVPASQLLQACQSQVISRPHVSCHKALPVIAALWHRPQASLHHMLSYASRQHLADSADGLEGGEQPAAGGRAAAIASGAKAHKGAHVVAHTEAHTGTVSNAAEAAQHPLLRAPTFPFMGLTARGPTGPHPIAVSTGTDPCSRELSLARCRQLLHQAEPYRGPRTAAQHHCCVEGCFEH